MTAAPPTTLADWLLARIAEDEAQSNLAEAIVVAPNGLVAWDEPGRSRVLQVSPHRLLDECSAKRWIVALHSGSHHCEDERTGGTGWVHDFEPCQTLRLLALPYADHDGFRDEWRP